MRLYNFSDQMKAVLNTKCSLYVIIAASIVLRLAACLFYVDLNSDFYWEYGETAKNIYHGRGYSLHYYDGEDLSLHFNEEIPAHPSAFMPPGYVMYLLPFLSIKSIVLRNLLILLGHTIAAAFVVAIVYRFTSEYFSEFSALIASFLAAFLPEFIYAVTSYTPTVFYHLLVMLLLYQLYKTRMAQNTKTVVIMGLAMSLIVYLRSEFSMFVVFVLVSFLLSRRIRQFLVVGGIIMLTLLPWQIRNYLTFGNRWVPFTTSFGLNFYRGHNPYNIGDWTDEEIDNRLLAHAENSLFEIEMNKIYTDAALRSLREQPGRELFDSLKKIMHLWVFNPDEPRARNMLYLLPWFAILMLSTIGLRETLAWRGHLYVYLFLIYSTAVAVMFFAQPRYQTMMKITLMPFAGFGVERVLRRFSSHLGKGVLTCL